MAVPAFALAPNGGMTRWPAQTTSIRNDDDILMRNIPDEALEAAAYAGQGNGGAYTIAFCTGQADCPFRTTSPMDRVAGRLAAAPAVVIV